MGGDITIGHSNFNIIHQNIRSILSSLNMLEKFASDERADIVTLTEHSRSRDELNDIYLGGFRLVSGFCRDTGEHGGSAIYWRNLLVCMERGD